MSDIGRTTVVSVGDPVEPRHCVRRRSEGVTSPSGPVNRSRAQTSVCTRSSTRSMTPPYPLLNSSVEVPFPSYP